MLISRSSARCKSGRNGNPFGRKEEAIRSREMPEAFGGRSAEVQGTFVIKGEVTINNNNSRAFLQFYNNASFWGSAFFAGNIFKLFPPLEKSVRQQSFREREREYAGICIERLQNCIGFSPPPPPGGDTENPWSINHHLLYRNRAAVLLRRTSVAEINT